MMVFGEDSIRVPRLWIFILIVLIGVVYVLLVVERDAQPNYRTYEFGEIEDSGFSVQVHLLSPTESTPSYARAAIALDEIYIIPAYLDFPVTETESLEICIEAVSAKLSLFGEVYRESLYDVVFSEPLLKDESLLCHSVSDSFSRPSSLLAENRVNSMLNIATFSEISESTELYNPTVPIINSPQEPNYTQYPYDKFEQYFWITLAYSFRNNGQIISEKQVNPKLVVHQPHFAFWEVQFHNLYEYLYSESELGITDSTIVAVFERPDLYKIGFPLVTIFMLFFIGLLAVVDSLEGFIEGAVAVFFGIFSLRQILLPAHIEAPTMVDSVLVGLYLLLSLPMLIKLIEMYQRQKSENDPDQLKQNAKEVGQLDFEPTDMTVAGIKRMIASQNDSNLLAHWLDIERNHKKRKSAIKLIESRVRQIKDLQA